MEFIRKRMSEDPQSVGGTNIDNAQIIASGMDTEMQQYAVQCANEAIEL